MYMYMHVVRNNHCQGSVATSMELWEAKYESADGEATCSRTLFVPGATAVCSGSAKSTEDCASFEAFCHKGDENLFVVSDDDDTVSAKYDV